MFHILSTLYRWWMFVLYFAVNVICNYFVLNCNVMWWKNKHLINFVEEYLEYWTGVLLQSWPGGELHISIIHNRLEYVSKYRAKVFVKPTRLDWRNLRPQELGQLNLWHSNNIRALSIFQNIYLRICVLPKIFSFEDVRGGAWLVRSVAWEQSGYPGWLTSLITP